MGTNFLTNLAAVAGKYEQYDILSAKLVSRLTTGYL